MASTGYDFLVALDLESTCDENNSNPGEVKVARDQGEIIELSYVVVSLQQQPPQIVHQEQVFVKPEKTPLTTFCTQLTGITQDQLDNADTLKGALQRVDKFVEAHFTSQDKKFCFVTHGEWDLRYQLPREAREKNIPLPNYFTVFFDAIQEVNAWLSLTQAGGKRVHTGRHTLIGLCSALGLQHEGRLHSGLDDALSVARITMALLERVDQWIAAQPPGTVSDDVQIPMTQPVDLTAQLNEFYMSQSKVVHLGGLPFKATHSEVDTWVGLAGIKAASLWMVRNSEGRPDGTGFAVFHSHEDAKACLALNGRILGERTIQVSPANEKYLESTEHIRAPFPQTAEEIPDVPRDMKPGVSDLSIWPCNRTVEKIVAGFLFSMNTNLAGLHHTQTGLVVSFVSVSQLRITEDLLQMPYRKSQSVIIPTASGRPVDPREAW
ncbi:hypothetical protein HK102_000037 [Quaeritorhiza haematococci]|nr:hypothetical protein HK102_000037 [Quaeritorhiza haematococci]